MMWSNNTKSNKFENDFEEVLERSHKLEWKETTEANTMRGKKEEAESFEV